VTTTPDSSNGKPRTIDIHGHLYPRPFLEYLERHGIDFGLPGLPFVPFPRLWDVDEHLRDMDSARIDVMVLSLGCPGVDAAEGRLSVELARIYNDAVAGVVAAHPDRFLGLAAVPMQVPDAAAAELERGVGELGLSGGHVFTNVRGRFLDDPALWPVYEAAESLGVPLLVHPTTPVCRTGADEYGLLISVAFLVETTLTASRLVLGGVLDRFPGLTLVLSHLGAVLPYILPRIDIETETQGQHVEGFRVAIDRPPSEYFTRFYIDSVSHHAAAYRCALETWGAERILLGSDYPYSRWERTVDAVEELGLPEEDARLILHGNTERLLGLTTGGST
jgi:predicted TIM-barrel fold metal-dependent hydrolase